jgi:hypothetical protein
MDSCIYPSLPEWEDTTSAVGANVPVLTPTVSYHFFRMLLKVLNIDANHFLKERKK